MTDYDELDELDLDVFDDFDSATFRGPSRRAGTDYLDKMWGGWGFGHGKQREDAILIAHGMVTSFLNAFARDGKYRVVFDPAMHAAGTDMDARRVVLTPSPLLDDTLTPQEAGAILTGLAVHEISHPRYGKATAKAIDTVFKTNGTAQKLSNLLDDYRIERRFVEDYPGYSGIFDAPMKYITGGIVKRNGGRNMRPDWDRLADVAVAAVRYPGVVDWDGFEEERDWWQAWAAQWGVENSPRRHVEAVRVAMKHIAARKLEQERKRQEEEERRRQEEEAESAAREAALAQSDDEGEEDENTAEEPDDAGVTGASEESDDDPEESDDYDDEGASDAPQRADDPDDADPDDDAPGFGDDDDMETLPPDDQETPPSADDDESIDALGINSDVDGDATDSDDDDEWDADDEAEGMSDEELSEQVDEEDSDLPTCAGSGAVDSAAETNGVDEDDVNDLREEADNVVRQAEYYESDGIGGKVDVARSMKGMIRSHLSNRYSRYFKKSDLAARFVRDALVQSRSGHTETSRYQKRGRLDQQALHRITRMDYRLFDRKKAPSPGRYLIWMLLDRSGSMDGWESVHQAQVATAIADATRHVKTVRAAVWAWSTGFRDNGWLPSVALAWRTGQNTMDIASTIDLDGGSTPDSEIMSWATSAILKEARLGETPVIILCSDGWGDAQLGQYVEAARRKGILVASVAFGALDTKAQEERFGRDGYVAWQGDIVSTARPLGKLIARIVGHDRRK